MIKAKIMVNGEQSELKHPELRCSRCDTDNAQGTMYCQGCGTKIKWVHAERTCSHCGSKWTPRTASPRTCPSCGYRLAKDNVVEIELPIQIRDIGDSIMESTCISCGKATRRFVEFKLDKNAPVKHSCYVCMEEYFKKKIAEDVVDIVENSFVTEGVERMSDGSDELIKE